MLRNRPTPTRATAHTLCQKCLQRGHFSYECQANLADRPYAPRPSRTAQLANPKLAPKLTSDIPNDLLRKKGIADEVLAKNEAARKRSLSVSSYSSVSTISTGPSRSRSRSIARKNGRPTLSLSPSGLHTSQRPPPSYTGLKRRRSRSSSADLYSSDVPPVRRRGSRHPSEDRNTRRRRSSVSPAPRGRGRNTNHGNDSAGSRTRSDSLDRSRVARRRKSLSPENRGRSSRNNLDRDRSPLRDINERQYSDRNVQRPPPPKEHSLSPFSKRVALTQAMGRATRR